MMLKGYFSFVLFCVVDYTIISVWGHIK